MILHLAEGYPREPPDLQCTLQEQDIIFIYSDTEMLDLFVTAPSVSYSV